MPDRDGLALETNAPNNTEDFRTLNRCLDDAIASAVTMYTRESHNRTFSGTHFVTPRAYPVQVGVTF